MKERLRWLGDVLWMKDDRLPTIVLFGQTSRSYTKSRLTSSGLPEDVISKDLKEM